MPNRIPMRPHERARLERLVREANGFKPKIKINYSHRLPTNAELAARALAAKPVVARPITPPPKATAAKTIRPITPKKPVARVRREVHRNTARERTKIGQLVSETELPLTPRGTRRETMEMVRRGKQADRFEEILEGASISQIERDILRLRIQHGLSWNQIASEVEMNERKVETLYNIALSHVRLSMWAVPEKRGYPIKYDFDMSPTTIRKKLGKLRGTIVRAGTIRKLFGLNMGQFDSMMIIHHLVEQGIIERIKRNGKEVRGTYLIR